MFRTFTSCRRISIVNVTCKWCKQIALRGKLFINHPSDDTNIRYFSLHNLKLFHNFRTPNNDHSLLNLFVKVWVTQYKTLQNSLTKSGCILRYLAPVLATGGPGGLTTLSNHFVYFYKISATFIPSVILPFGITKAQNCLWNYQLPRLNTEMVWACGHLVPSGR